MIKIDYSIPLVIIILGLIVILGILALIPIYKNQKMSVNPFDSAFYKLMLIYFIITLIRLIGFMPRIVHPQIAFPTIGVNLQFEHMTYGIIIVSELIFVFYLYDLKELYTLPIVTFMYVFLWFTQSANTLAYEIISLIFIFICIAVFIYKGLKNRNGNVFSLGCFIIVDSLSQLLASFNQNYFIVFYGTALSFFILNLGAWEVIDNYLFYGRERRREAKSAWVSTLISNPNYVSTPEEVESQLMGIISPKEKIEPKTIEIICPICNTTKWHTFSKKLVQERTNNENGIVKFLIEENLVCKHSFIAYMDRNFEIRGYASIDVKI